jgi:metal-responsive CopG/Arc/MetJ family transcriptional regulator
MSEDFSKGKRGPVINADPNKVRITIRLDADIIDHFKRKVHDAGGGNYQTLINDALRRLIEEEARPLEDTLRRVIREELSQAAQSTSQMLLKPPDNLHI